MLKPSLEAGQSSNFTLKEHVVELLPTRETSGQAYVSIEELDRLRTRSRVIPASKHGLEIICGASCETGAQ